MEDFVIKENKYNYDPLSKDEEAIGKDVVECFLKVHKELCPGLLERVYEVCLAYELKNRRRFVERQIDIPISYGEMKFDEGLRLDLRIDELVICELKAVDQVNPVWEAQVLSHRKLTNLRLGYLINFNVPLIKQGIRRFVV